MEPKEEQILTDLVNAVKSDVVVSLENAGRRATGQTEQNITVEKTGNAVQLLAPGYIDILERGRGPTRPNAPPGDPLLIDRIKLWVKAKGIPDAAAWAITKSIHKKGYTGRPAVVSGPLSDQNIDSRANEAADQLASLLLYETLKIKL